MKYRLELTGSQLMALRTILSEHVGRVDRVVTYIDCSQDPLVPVKPEDLLVLVMTAEIVAANDSRRKP